jgi:antagonist of KipI
MADHQTTGGYPRIGSVIKADLPKLAQVMPNEKIKFKMISLTDAQRELLSREEKLNTLKQACHERFKKYLQS